MGTTVDTSNLTVFQFVDATKNTRDIASKKYVDQGEKFGLKVEKERRENPVQLVQDKRSEERQAFMQVTALTVTANSKDGVKFETEKQFKEESIADASIVRELLTRTKTQADILAQESKTPEELRADADLRAQQLSNLSTFDFSLQDEIAEDAEKTAAKRFSEVLSDAQDQGSASVALERRVEELRKNAGNTAIDDRSVASGNIDPIPARKFEDRELDLPEVKILKENIENLDLLEKLRDQEDLRNSQTEEVRDGIKKRVVIADLTRSQNNEERNLYFERKDYNDYEVKQELREHDKAKEVIIARNEPINDENIIKGALHAYSLLQEKEQQQRNLFDEYV